MDDKTKAAHERNTLYTDQSLVLQSMTGELANIGDIGSVESVQCGVCQSDDVEISLTNHFDYANNMHLIYFRAPDYRITGRTYAIKCKSCGAKQSGTHGRKGNAG